MISQNISLYYLVRYALSKFEPEEKKDSEKRRSAAAAVLRRLDESNEQQDEEGNERVRKEDLILNQYEQMIAMEVVAPEDISVSFKGIQMPLLL